MRKMKQFFLVVLVCGWVLGGAAFALGSEMNPADIALQMQKTYDKTIALKAKFDQVSSLSGMSNRQRRAGGTMVIQKPGLLRWDYVTPDEQVLVSDGEIFSLYLASENQMIVTPAREYLQEDITYNFFSGTGDVLRDFEVYPVEDTLKDSESYAIKLIPKKTHAQVENLIVWVAKDSFLVKRLQILDHLGSTTDLSFSHITVDQPFPVDFFHFTPPEGTEIISQ